MSLSSLTPFERGFLAHLIADWLLQNDWMARNKMSLRHPAAYAHALIHFTLMALALGVTAGLVLALLHMLIDTRIPLRWWQRAFMQSNDGPTASLITIWADQVLHLVIIAGWIALTS